MYQRAISNRMLLSTWAAVLLFVASLSAQGPQAVDASREALVHWQHVSEIEFPAETTAPWRDVIVTPEIFDRARYDLHDLRIYSEGGQEVPYSMRVRSTRSERQTLKAREFNRIEGPDKTSELTLDLGADELEHNAVAIDLAGSNYRRRVELEASDDAEEWRPLREQTVVNFRRGGAVLRDEMLEYPLSRFRYLRIRVHRDPGVDGDGVVQISDFRALRTVEIPGEQLSLAAAVGNREAVRADDGPGSRWVFDLGGDQTPVSSIELQIADTEFVRNFSLEAGGPANSGFPFSRIASGVWRRRAGEPLKPMRVEFSEARAARLRLIVTDHRNPPLQVDQVSFAGDARQVVFATLEGPASYKMYFGNPQAEDPSYDFARNLPQKLEPPPNRSTLAALAANPLYKPEPLPLTERWPWLVYVVLSLACVVLGAIATSLSRAAIAAHESVADAAG